MDYFRDSINDSSVIFSSIPPIKLLHLYLPELRHSFSRISFRDTFQDSLGDFSEAPSEILSLISPEFLLGTDFFQEFWVSSLGSFEDSF